MMTDRPILFSGPMVRALLDGRKTQTRRVLKPQPAAKVVGFQRVFSDPPYFEAVGADGKPCYGFPASFHSLSPFPTIRHGIGDRLWVREAWRTTPSLDAISPSSIIGRSQEAGYRRGWCPIHFEADGARLAWSNSDWPGIGDEPGRYRQAMHMPRPLSRLTLTVTDVRVQRLQDISSEDAEAEGLLIGETECGDLVWSGAHQTYPIPPEQCHHWPEEAFAALWDNLNADRAPWSDNPWVVAVTFDVHKRNIDQVEGA
jgi:hypothetical protein